MRELVDYLVGSILTKDAYDIVEVEDGTNIEIRVQVDSDKIGKVIGKAGRIAKAIRTIVKASALNSDKHYDVIISDRE
jgi:uncharacterized protein